MFREPDKKDVAKSLADAHRKAEPSIRRIHRIISNREDDVNEPVKLLEVNPDTSPSGIVPIAFGPDPPDIPFPSVVIEITQEEFDQIKLGKLQLPHGWQIDQRL
jgi:hypothetical protein